MSADQRRRAVRRRRLTAAAAAGGALLGVALLLAVLWGGGAGRRAGGSTPSGPVSSGAGCRVPTVAKAQVEAYREAVGGGCVPPLQLVSVRCAPSQPPLLLVGDRRFLGGAYSVELTHLPGDAHRLGVGPQGEVWWSPDTHLLAVRSGGVIRRWLALPPAVDATARPAVSFLGDSVMLGAQGAIRHAFAGWDLRFDARESRSTTDGLPIAQRWRPSLRDAIVVQLGTNDGGIPSYYRIHMQRILHALRGVPVVVWLNIAHARSYYALDDQVIRDELSHRPNTVLADWNAALPADGAYADGLHLTPSGGVAMARLARQVLGPWRRARAGAGPAACVDALRAAL